MPNHVKNIIKCKGILDLPFVVEGDYGLRKVDFEKIIPMPDNIYDGELGPEEFALYGKNNWYDWRIENWGTVSNAYDYEEISKNHIEFLTSWSAPIGIYKAIAQQFPNIIMEIKYADEDYGWNCGKIKIENGEFAIKNYKGGGKSAVKFARKVWDDYEEGDDE